MKKWNANKASKALSVKFNVLNVVIHPVKDQCTEKYIELLNRIKECHVSVNTYGDKSTKIRSLFPHDNYIRGILVNYTQLENENWYNSETEEIEQVETNPNLNPNAKELEFIFVPKTHRIALIKRGKSFSLSQALRFFSEAFSEISDGNVKVSLVSTFDVIDSIFQAKQVTSLKVSLSYSNNDNNEDWEEMIDSQAKQSELNSLAMEARGTKEHPICITEDNMLGGFIKLSRENGQAEVTGYFDGKNKRETRKTKEYPEVMQITHGKDEDPYELISTCLLKRYAEK